MKKLFLISLLAMSIASTPASAFDLGSIAGAVTGDKCLGQAATLASKAKTSAVDIFDKLSANGALTAADLNISDATFNTVKSYIASGCAKKHITKAIAAAGAAAAN